jgi:hypothetical protein
MRGLWVFGAAALLAGCVGTPLLSGTMGAPSFVTLQQMCGGEATNYGDDAQSVYSAFFDAYVANRHGGLSKADYCAFQASIAQHYAARGASGDVAARARWVAFFNEQRAKAISWRAAVDPTLRSG